LENEKRRSPPPRCCGGGSRGRKKAPDGQKGFSDGGRFFENFLPIF
jgi:hypothetical protein